jgi:4-coumarate--CoA ligase
MTKVTCIALEWDPRLELISGSVGELLANCHAKIMSEDCTTKVTPGERGEMWIQAPKFVFTRFTNVFIY